MTEGTKNFFKFKNISLQPTRQNTILPTEGTAEQQYQLIQASTRQQALDDIRQDTQPSTPEQSHDVSSSSSLEEATPDEQQVVVSTSSSSFELLNNGDDNYQGQVPRDNNKELLAPPLQHDIPDILNDTDSEDEHTVIPGNNTNIHTDTATDQVHDSVNKAAKVSIEAESETSDEEDTDLEEVEIERHREIFRQLSHKCEEVDIQIGTKGW